MEYVKRVRQEHLDSFMIPFVKPSVNIVELIPNIITGSWYVTKTNGDMRFQ